MDEHLPLRKSLYAPDGTFRDEIAEIIVSAINIEWFNQLEGITQYGYLRNLRSFLDWLYKTKFKSTTKFNILNLYQEHKVNECNVKSGNTGVNIIKIMITRYLNSNNSISKSRRTLCNIIIQRHRPLPSHKTKQPSLVSWFTDIPWLKYDMDEKDFSHLGKPRMLSESFIYTVATLLLEISESKKKIKSAIESLNKKIRFWKYKDPYTKRKKRSLFLKQLFETIFQDPNFNDPGIRELFLIDCIANDDNRDQIKDILERESLTFQEKKRMIRSINRMMFNQPNLLSPREDLPHSFFEENLFSFICAWLVIPPFDIYKLKRSNFVVVLDETGLPQLIKASYYKGRSGVVHEPQTITAGSIVGKAILNYLEAFHEHENLFSIGSTYNNNLTFGSSSCSKLLAICMESSYLRKKINKQLHLNSATDIFSIAYLTLYRNHDSTFTNWNNFRKRQKLTHNDNKLYKANVKKWLPPQLFKLGLIKNTAVHAKSDKFRINDPVNENSHTSQTEFQKYLTDSNKEWVNINGAVTRLVLRKVEESFNLNLKLSASISHSKLLQTKFEEDLVSSFNSDYKSIQNSADLILNKMIVLNTPETVLFMRHYIAQVVSQMQVLIQKNLTFFEETALPNAEWMDTILATKLSPKVVKEGNEKYERFKSLLPELFKSYINCGDLN